MIIRALILFMFFTGTSAAGDCTEELLLSFSWKPFKTADIYTLKSNGDMECFNEKRHRNECDYVYMSDYQGVPRSWELLGVDKIKITFKQGMFTKRALEFDCEFIIESKRLKVGRMELVQLELYRN